MLSRDKKQHEDRRILQEEKPPSSALLEVARRHNLHPVIVRLLAQRPFANQDEIHNFLSPTLAQLPEPLLMGGMAEAVELIYDGITEGVLFVIWGDYDVDGTTGTALLVQFFRDLGQDVVYCIPDRISHGYGLHCDLLRGIAEKNSVRKILITVDCGISANEEIAEAKTLGFTVIVTDHHIPPEGRMLADAVINPKQEGCSFPSDCLAGVGLAFYLACGIRQHLRKKHFFQQKQAEPDVGNLLDLVALGTLADMVPLDQANRALVKEGLCRIEGKKRPGVEALLKVARMLDKNGRLIGRIGAEDVGFVFGPMINAAGRLGSAGDAVELFLADNLDDAIEIASKLNQLNDERKRIVEEAYEKILRGLSAEDASKNIVVVRGQYHHGVVGIVAARLVEKLRLPVLLFAKKEDQEGRVIWRGSGRSLPGIHLHKALSECADVIDRFGGHSMAVGLQVAEERIDQFEICVDAQIAKQKTGTTGEENGIVVDLTVDLHEVFAREYMSQFQLLEPFGNNNKPPTFKALHCVIVEARQIGANNTHLKLALQSRNGTIIQGVGFGMGHLGPRIRERKAASVVFTPMTNRFRETQTWEARVVDLQLHE